MSISTIFPPPDREASDRERLPIARRDGSDGAVDERRLHEQVEPRVGERLACDRRSPTDLRRAVLGQWTEVRP
jgi:hypothetical protein